MLDWLYSLFGTIIRFIYYNMGQNFGVALIIFTVFIKLIILPLGIKQQRSMMHMQKLQPKLSELQRKYANDKDKLGRETMELYRKYNVSPFGGCLPMIIQLVILLVMVQIVYRPGTHVMGIEGLGRDLTEQINAAKNAGMNFQFLWWNLAEKPAFSFMPTAQQLLTWVLPILATVATYFSGVLTQKTQGAKPSQSTGANQEADAAQQMSKSMTTMMPLMTLFFTFTLPASASLYWFISTVTQMLQQVFVSKAIKIEVEEEGGSYHDKLNKKRKKH